jgi:general secretion pathway protein G
MKRLAARTGFTLLELIVVMAAIGLLAAAIAPPVVQRILDGRIDETRVEARILHEAMVGKAGENRFGFVGDIGRLPSSFQELAQASGLPAYTTTTFRNVGMGWRGPYVNTGMTATDYLTDAFGRSYTGATTGQVRSPGPDGAANTTDDIVYPSSASSISGHLVVTVKTITGGKTVVDPVGYRVELLYASSGVEALLGDAAPPFSFSNVPMGVHAIRVVKTSNPNAGSLVSQDTVTVRPAGTTAAELWF